jgi:hypothetical protein
MNEMGIREYDVVSEKKLKEIEAEAVCHLAKAILQEPFRS